MQKGGRDSSKSGWKPMSHNRWTMGVRSNCTYVSFLFRVKRVAQIALQELNLINQFNFNLALPDIVANKTLGESTLPGNFFFQSYVSKPFALTPCLGDLVFLFFNLLFVYVITRDKWSLPQISLWVLGPSLGSWMFLSDTVVKNPKEQRKNIKHRMFHYWVKIH